MKIFYFVLLVFLSFDNCFSQDSSAYIFHLNKLPPEGILLDKGWKFQTGDNPDYAKPEYDDSKWQSINPTLDIHDSLPQIPKSGIVWFRLHLLIDDTTVNNQLAMMIQQSGASEMYLNGALIHRFGIISPNANEIKAISPLEKPVSFPITKSDEQVLAVRYALQPHIRYSTHFLTENRALYIIVNTIENASAQYHHKRILDDGGNLFLIGVFLIIGVLYLAFYLFYTSQKANLYFSLYGFLGVIASYLFILRDNDPQIQQWYLINNVILAREVIKNFFMLAAIYTLFEQRKDLIYYSLFVFGLVSIPLGAFIYGWGYLIGSLYFDDIVNFVVIYIAFKAVKNRKKGAWIIVAGGLSYLVSWFIFTLQYLGFLTSIDPGYTFKLAVLSIPVTVSIYLGYDFALTNRSLQQKLAEVEKLSREKLEMEKKRQAAQIEAMVATQEQERKRISRDLHDDVGTKLSALNLFLSSLNEKATITNNEEIKSLTCSSKQFIKEAMYDVRQLLLNLSPTVLEEFGYTTAVEGLVNKINETKQIHFDLVVFGINHR